MSIMRRTLVDSKRGPAAAVTDVENRRQAVADTLLQLQQRERRLQEAEHCVNASYLFFTSTLQVVSSTCDICCSLLRLVVHCRAQDLVSRFKERNTLQGPMEDEIKAATSLAVNSCCSRRLCCCC
jgi:hypothetical protein